MKTLQNNLLFFDLETVKGKFDLTVNDFNAAANVKDPVKILAQKQAKLKRTIYHYLGAKNLKNQPLRIDYVAITGEPSLHINWLKNVF